MTKAGDIVRVPELGHDLHVVIGQAFRGWWIQNLHTGSLPTKHYPGSAMPGGWLPKDMVATNTRHYDYAQLACQPAGTNHSDDTVTHYSGSGTPEVLCGYHALANTNWKVA